MLKASFRTILLIPILLFSHEPVDIVYTWVDGEDPAWQNIKAREAEKELGVQTRSADATQARRFRCREELKYSLRSIHQFAPWVRHIYIVTFNQKPSWIQEDPKITFVDHREIFPDKSHLPTFNSMAIECHLHRIPGLQEHYVYFNDDFFLGRAVSFTDFFTESGKMKVFLSKVKMPKSKPKPDDDGFASASKNTVQLLNKVIGKEKRHNHAHTPYPARKSVVCRIEKQFYKVFASVSSHKFRSLEDFTITNGIIPYLAMYQGDAEKASIDHKTIHFGKDLVHDTQKIQDLIERRPCFFCIEDTPEIESPESKELLTNFFASYFPTPAPWEKTGEEEQ